MKWILLWCPNKCKREVECNENLDFDFLSQAFCSENSFWKINLLPVVPRNEQYCLDSLNSSSFYSMTFHWLRDPCRFFRSSQFALFASDPTPRGYISRARRLPSRGAPHVELQPRAHRSTVGSLPWRRTAIHHFGAHEQGRPEVLSASFTSLPQGHSRFSQCS